MTPLQKDAANLLFALHDAWPYVHGWCTIKGVKERISALIRKHGDFADIHAELDAKANEPVTSATMFDKSELDALLKQIGYYANERAIDIVEAAVVAKFKPEGHQYRTWYSEPDNCWSAWRTMPPCDMATWQKRVDAGTAEIRPLFTNRLSVAARVDDGELSTVEHQLLGLMGGEGASDDHQDVRDVFRKANISERTIDTVFERIIPTSDFNVAGGLAKDRLTAERAEFNRAINFALDQGSGAYDFLRAWREGDTSEWPEFKAAEVTQ